MEKSALHCECFYKNDVAADIVGYVYMGTKVFKSVYSKKC